MGPRNFDRPAHEGFHSCPAPSSSLALPVASLHAYCWQAPAHVRAHLVPGTNRRTARAAFDHHGARVLPPRPLVIRSHLATFSFLAHVSVSPPSPPTPPTPPPSPSLPLSPPYPASSAWALPQAVSARALQGFPARRAGLGAVVVEYDDDDTDELEMCMCAEERFPAIMVTGNPEGSQARPGSFEVSFGHSLLFSRLQLERLPSPEELEAPLEPLLDDAQPE
ncbi:unnamed protein product [Closterium sp. NIES-64]|nr:unnamed protein product [Closterium sp. NIES-64]